MASSSLSPIKTEEHDAFSGIEPKGTRRKVEESSRLFDVFINHRGPDVKQTLALQLYNSLSELGIHAFLDSEEKELGNSFPSTIENAIHSAKVHVAIFSMGYAESPWCLAELVLMLQSRAKIIPLFYGVKPSDLRFVEKGEYAKTFTEYERRKRYMENLREWKEALQSVSFVTGYEISSNFKISDCQSIVSAVQKEVQAKRYLHVAKHPVGLDRLVKDFERLCLHKLVEDFERQCEANEANKEKVKIVGIFGMGGVGKTTLAKELFNRKQSQYGTSCFLFDVREAYANKSFPSLQLTILKDLFGRDKFNFHCTEEGTACIADCIERSKPLSFLLVLDDIDHVQQLDALLINNMLKKSFNSLVIVTTRDTGVLINTGITIAYNLKGMDVDYARELFCLHAFGQPLPARDYENMVQSFLNVCGGLPLSLQVLGCHVHGRDRNYWSLELNKFRKTLPRDIRQRLGISIDALDNEEQHILMDLACFFVDKSKSIAMEVWDASGWSAKHALETLKNKCLVQEIERLAGVGEDRFALRMHAHLQDLGREMADRSSPRRLWRSRDLECLESNGFQTILSQTEGRCFHSFLDKSMSCLVTYFIGESDTTADTSTFLLWLKLEFQCELNKNFNTIQPSIPSWIPLQNLRCLIIWNMIFEPSWQIHLQEFTQLKELQLCNSALEEFSDLSGISNTLEKILIHKCTGLITVSGLSDLKYLIELNISECPDLQNLSVVHLRSLEKIVLHNCYRLKTVSGISDLRKLGELDISGWPVFEQLRLVNLNNLKHITVNYLSEPACFELDDCKSLETISGGSGFGNLESINIRNCPRLEGLPFVQGLRDLKTVTIDGCDKLKSLLFSECRNLERVTLKLDLTCLEKITIQDCGKLNCFQMFKCISLKQVCISSCSNLEELPCFARQTCLEKITIVRCEKLQNISLPTKLLELGIEGCRELKTVAAFCGHSGCLELQELSGVARLSYLKLITVENCDKLQRIQGIAELGVLQILHLFNCPELEELPCFEHQNCLEDIKIIRCGKLQNITLPSTTVTLRVEDCSELKTVAIVCDHNERFKLQNFSTIIQKITIQNCTKLQAVQGIDELRSLGTLQLSNCPELEELPYFSRQTCLKEIIVVECGKLQNITLPTTFVALTIEACRELKTVAAICDHSELLKKDNFSSVVQQITIQNCDKLQTVQGIDELHALESLILFNCLELEELPCFACQSCLEEIIIVRCGKLQKITLPTTLVTLTIEGCRELKTVVMIYDHSEHLKLQNLTSVVQQITIQNCDKLQMVQGIDQLSALGILQLFNCSELEDLPCFAHQTCLEKISIVRCGKLQNITLPIKLVELVIECCTELKTVAAFCNCSKCLEHLSVAQLSSLKSITIHACDKLQTMQGIDELHKLKRMQLAYCSNSAIWNCIPILKNMPPELLVVIGRAVDGALEILNPHLFSDGDAVIFELGTRTSVLWQEIMPELSAVILCAVVIINDWSRVRMTNLSSTNPWRSNLDNWWWNLDPWRSRYGLQQGEWIITMVTTDLHKISSYCSHDLQFEDVLVRWGIMKKGYKVGVKKGEERKIQHVLHSVIDVLYQKNKVSDKMAISNNRVKRYGLFLKEISTKKLYPSPLVQHWLFQFIFEEIFPVKTLGTEWLFQTTG